jgi:hypothetical protein
LVTKRCPILSDSRKVASPIDEKEYTINLDFLTEPEAVGQMLPFVKVQEDLTACLIEGSSIVFKFKYENEVEAVLPRNGKISIVVNTANIVGALTMKGLALLRLNDKDSYDVYAVAGYYNGSPIEASRAYIEHVRRANLSSKEKEIIRTSLNRISQAFKIPDSYGVYSASRFVGANINTDVYMGVSAFIKNVASHLEL